MGGTVISDFPDDSEVKNLSAIQELKETWV